MRMTECLNPRSWQYIPDPGVVQVEVVPGDDALRLEQHSPPGLRIRSVWMAEAKPFIFSVFLRSSLVHAPQRPGLHATPSTRQPMQAGNHIWG